MIKREAHRSGYSNRVHMIELGGYAVREIYQSQEDAGAVGDTWKTWSGREPGG